ncbi:MAG: hypothetical protein ACRDRH_20655 [Pseudonocardia sp.]
MRQRQEAWKLQQAEREREAAQLRARQEAEQERARLAEAERRLQIQEAEAAVRLAEYRRQWAIEAEQARVRRETDDQARREREEAAEQQRRRQEEAEHKAATTWWQKVSAAQSDELLAAVADPVWRKTGSCLEFDEDVTREHAYGVAIFRKAGRYRDRRELYGGHASQPGLLHRLPPEVPVFVRNAHEAAALIETGAIAPDRVVHFGRLGQGVDQRLLAIWGRRGFGNPGPATAIVDAGTYRPTHAHHGPGGHRATRPAADRQGRGPAHDAPAAGRDPDAGLLPLCDSTALRVRPAFGSFHCFRCGEGGDAITFTARIESRP